MKNLIQFLSDKKLLLGIGIGIILTIIMMSGINLQGKISKGQIEEKASGYGMRYPEDLKVINGDVKK